MIIHACDLCGIDIVSYARWVEVPLNIDNWRIAVKRLAGIETTILHFNVDATNRPADFDLCAACFRDAMRRYIAETTTTPQEDNS